MIKNCKIPGLGWGFHRTFQSLELANCTVNLRVRREEGQGIWWQCFSVLFVYQTPFVEEWHIYLTVLSQNSWRTAAWRLHLNHNIPADWRVTLPLVAQRGVSAGLLKPGGSVRLINMLQVYLCHHDYDFCWFTYWISCLQHKLNKRKTVYEMPLNPS